MTLTRPARREQKREIERSIRQLQREQLGVQREEMRMISEMRRGARTNQPAMIRTQARGLVQIRRHKEKFTALVTHLRAVSMQLTRVGSTDALASAMRGATKAMQGLNAQVDLPETRKIMREFMRQAEQMEMVGDAVEDTIDGMGGDDEEEEVDMLVDEVLDEIGISAGRGLVDAPRAAAREEKISDEDRDLEARVNNLNR